MFRGEARVVFGENLISVFSTSFLALGRFGVFFAISDNGASVFLSDIRLAVI